jgi:hypothetical protein
MLATIQFRILSYCLPSINAKITMYKIIILLVVSYGCETWYLTLREEYRQRVSENWMLRRIYGPKKNEVTGGCSKLHNEELNNLRSLPDKIRVIKSRRMR